MSAPAKKVRPSQRITIALMLASARPCLMPASIPCRTAAPSALTGGVFEMMTSTSSWRSVVIGEVILLLLVPPRPRGPRAAGAARVVSGSCLRGSTNSSQCTVDHRLQLAADRVGVGRRHLRHEHHVQPLDGVDEERGREHHAPIIFADRA